MADISLTASMRSNLLSLQNTQNLMDLTQERLSSGKKVNSAIDNPSAYYASRSLTNRANDLNALIDSMGQGIQTIKAATQGIEAITKFAEQAKAIANSARDVPSNMKEKVSTTGKVKGTDTFATAGQIIMDERADMSKLDLTYADAAAVAAKNSAISADFYIDGKKVTVKAESAAVNTAVTGKQFADAVKLELEKNGLKVDITNATTGAMTITSPTGSAITVANSEAGAVDAMAAVTPTGDREAHVIIDVAAGTTVDAMIADFNAQAPNLIAEIDADTGKLVIRASDAGKETKNGFQVAVEGGVATALPGLSGRIDTVMTSENAIVQRAKYAAQFDSILNQIDQLAKDSGYKGVNLLKENDLKVIFNEDRSSTMEIKGVDASSKGLSLNASTNKWIDVGDIDNAVTEVEDAINALRTMASEFGNNFSVVQNREEFTDNLINVLTGGSDKLTLADMNEESANMLALQTRQQLAVNSLSLASQAAQSVLKLF